METVKKKKISGCQRFWGREALYQKSPVLQLLIKTFSYDIVIVDTVVAQMVKSLPTMQETQVQSLGQEDPLEKEMQPTLGLLPGKSQGWRSVVGYSAWGHKGSDMTS